jgi:site-specific recombinase XerD
MSANVTLRSTTLTQRFCEDIELSGRAQRTKKQYRLVLADFERFVGASAEAATDDDVRSYALHLVKERKLKPSSLRVYTAGLKVLFETTLNRPMPVLRIVKPQQQDTLPVVLSRDEVKRLLAAVKKPMLRTILLLNYSCGLRLSEAVQLPISAIDSARMVLSIRGGKGNKDRQVPLPKRTLDYLRAYFRQVRPQGTMLFPSRGDANRPIHITALQKAFKPALQASSINKPATIHSMRHSYATHLIEDGIHLLVLQRILGHSKLKTTVRYVHLTAASVDKSRPIINGLSAAL